MILPLRVLGSMSTKVISPTTRQSSTDIEGFLHRMLEPGTRAAERRRVLGSFRNHLGWLNDGLRPPESDPG